MGADAFWWILEKTFGVCLKTLQLLQADQALLQLLQAVATANKRLHHLIKPDFGIILIELHGTVCQDESD